jgi:hypothetical protein
MNLSILPPYQLLLAFEVLQRQKIDVITAQGNTQVVPSAPLITGRHHLGLGLQPHLNARDPVRDVPECP